MVDAFLFDDFVYALKSASPETYETLGKDLYRVYMAVKKNIPQNYSLEHELPEVP